MKIIIDLDPKLQRKLEAMSGARGRTVAEFCAEVLDRVLTRDPSASSSSGEGVPSPAMVDATKKAAAVQAAAAAAAKAPAMEELIFLLEPLISRFRLTDRDGAQRRALLAEMQMLPQDVAVLKLTEMLKLSLA